MAPRRQTAAARDYFCIQQEDFYEDQHDRKRNDHHPGD